MLQALNATFDCVPKMAIHQIHSSSSPTKDIMLRIVLLNSILALFGDCMDNGKRKAGGISINEPSEYGIKEKVVATSGKGKEKVGEINLGLYTAEGTEHMHAPIVPIYEEIDLDLVTGKDAEASTSNVQAGEVAEESAPKAKPKESANIEKRLVFPSWDEKFLDKGWPELAE
ncbi:hypothetical protein niasHT_012181 [Heterodera trifolii]|uniref:Uncharacterized protein n=1 Tax=Heterodera trifolii TaxID=157864 RepID=A0ABD2KU15_9BILA